MHLRLAAALLAVPLAGCAAASTPGSGSAPAFDPLAFFTGRTRSSGTIDLAFSAPEGFTAQLRGVRQPGELLLIQHFTYANGRTQDRVWHLHATDPGHIAGVANDVVGEAEGTVRGPTLHLRYVLETQPGNWLRNVRMDQRMTLEPDGSVSNRAAISKLGLPLGSVSERFTRAPG